MCRRLRGVAIGVTLGMEIKKESEKREIKNSIEAPSGEAGASRSEEMVIEHEERDDEAE